MANRRKRRKKVIPQKVNKPPKLKEKFPISYSYSEGTDSLWLRTFKIDDDELISDFATLLSKDLKSLGESLLPVDLNVIVHRIFNEIIKVKSSYKSEENKIKIAFLQFCWGLFTTTAYNSWNELHYNYEFFLKSLYDEVYEDGFEYEIKTHLVAYYLYWNKDEIYDSKDIAENWLDQLFFYSANFGGLKEWCENFKNMAIIHLQSRREVKKHYISLISHMYSWGDQYKEIELQEALFLELERLNKMVTWKKIQVKSLIFFQKLLMRNHYQSCKEDIYKELDEKGRLNAIEQLQALTYLFSDITKIESYFSKLKDSISAYNKTIEGEAGLGTIRNTYLKSRTFSNILNSTIYDAIKHGRSDLITELIVHFYNPGNEKINDNILYIVPNHQEGVIYCFLNQTLHANQKDEKIIEKIIDLGNQLFNSTLVLRGAPSQLFFDKQNVIGYPNEEFGKSFEKALGDIYKFDLLKDELTHKIDSICQFGFNSWPIQNLLLKNLGVTYPVNLSFLKKKKYPENLKVLFWKGTSYTSEFEAKFVTEIFGEKNIKLLSGDDSSKREFLNEILSQNYNLIWISSHGQHEHYEPNKSSIILSETEKITFEDYNSLKTYSDRRTLFFFNICEGGVQAQISEFKNISFPNLICDNSQDVLSHLWMVDPIIALLFGIVFATKLGGNTNYFSSYSETVAIFIQGKGSVINELKNNLQDCKKLIEMIESRDDIEWENILYWGSSIYYI